MHRKKDVRFWVVNIVSLVGILLEQFRWGSLAWTAVPMKVTLWHQGLILNCVNWN